MALERNTLAPEFALSTQFGETVSLAELRRSGPVALVFFPLAFSGTCTAELCELRDNLDVFRAAGVQLVGISVDSKWALRAWAAQEGYDFPLLADFWPHGEVARRFGVFLDDKGFATRATFLIDEEGVIRESFVTAPGEPRQLQSYRDAVASLVEAG